MRLQIDAVTFYNNEIQIIPIEVDEKKYPIVRKKFEHEHKKIVDFLKKLKAEGKINTIYSPKNKNMKKQLESIVNGKRILKRNLKKLISLFHRNI